MSLGPESTATSASLPLGIRATDLKLSEDQILRFQAQLSAHMMSIFISLKGLAPLSYDVTPESLTIVCGKELGVFIT